MICAQLVGVVTLVISAAAWPGDLDGNGREDLLDYGMLQQTVMRSGVVVSGADRVLATGRAMDIECRLGHLVLRRVPVINGHWVLPCNRGAGLHLVGEHVTQLAFDGTVFAVTTPDEYGTVILDRQGLSGTPIRIEFVDDGLGLHIDRPVIVTVRDLSGRIINRETIRNWYAHIDYPRDRRIIVEFAFATIVVDIQPGEPTATYKVSIIQGANAGD